MKRTRQFSILVTLLILWVQAQTQTNCSLIGNWGYGPCWAVTPSVGYTYMGSGRVFMIMNNSNPAALVKVGELLLPDNIEAITISGNYAYVAANEAGLRIVNISNPALPVETGYLTNNDYIVDVDVSGSYAYLASLSYGMKVISITNPANPVSVASFPTTGAARGIDVNGSYAYIADDQYGLRIVNITNPAIPVSAGNCPLAGDPQDVVVQGNYAYVAANSSGMRIINITNPASPSEVGHYAAGGQVFQVAISGNFAYVPACYAGLKVVNISNPASPQLTGAIGLSDAMYIGFFNNLAWVGEFGHGVHIVNVTSPSTPVYAGYFRTAGWSGGITQKDNYTYLAAGEAGMGTLDTGNPENPVQSAFDSTYHGFLAVQGDLLYSTNDAYSVIIRNISNPLQPVYVGSFTTPSFPGKIVFSGDYAYVSNGMDGLRIIDISNPAAPVEIGHYITTGWVADVAVQGHYAYIHDGNEGLKILDVSDPQVPVLAGSLTYPGQGGSIAVLDNYVYFANTYLGLYVIDVSNPSIPLQVSTVSCWAQGVTLKGYYAYISQSTYGIMIVDMFTPANPLVIGGYNTPGQTESEVIYKNAILYIPDSFAGMEVIAVPPYATIQGPDTLCSNESGSTYTTEPGNLNYVWSVSVGGIIISGGGSSSITVKWMQPGPHWIHVNYTTPYGFQATHPGELTVYVKPAPPTPLISVNGNILTSNVSDGNQWLLESNVIPGATAQTYVATHSGNYSVVVSDQGCTSDTSDQVMVILSGTPGQQDFRFSILPNPSDGAFEVDGSGIPGKPTKLTIFDAMGNKVYEKTLTNSIKSIRLPVDIRPVDRGMYFVAIESSAGRYIQRTIIN